jgi:hypothetical protein
MYSLISILATGSSLWLLPSTTSGFVTRSSLLHRQPSFLRVSEDDLAELQSRIENLRQARPLTGVVHLPVVAFDALLPLQCMNGSSSDPTFCCFLRDLSIGGVFAMISVDYKARKLRRDGVLCKIEVSDAAVSTKDRIPTAVDFRIVGLQRCRVVGSAEDMQARVGRWRRDYDPDGEETRLGWGIERFVDALEMKESDDAELCMEEATAVLQPTEWSSAAVQLSGLKDKDVNDLETIELAKSIPPLLDQWQALVSDEQTYDNTNVVAASRILTGQPGLYVNPAALLRNVRGELGPRVPTDPTDLALYGAALINPLPALGVSPEIRGRVLAAPTAKRRLEILQWGIERSIRNLKGISPL